MADQNIKVRHIQKHDTEENWNKAVNFIPKQGEIIIYDVDSNYSYERMKVGDGTTLVSSLPFIDAQKQDKLTFDDVPTVESTNPVTSGGIKSALDEKDINKLKIKGTISSNDDFEEILYYSSDGDVYRIVDNLDYTPNVYNIIIQGSDVDISKITFTDINVNAGYMNVKGLSIPTLDFDKRYFGVKLYYTNTTTPVTCTFDTESYVISAQIKFRIITKEYETIKNSILENGFYAIKLIPGKKFKVGELVTVLNGDFVKFNDSYNIRTARMSNVCDDNTIPTTAYVQKITNDLYDITDNLDTNKADKTELIGKLGTGSHSEIFNDYNETTGVKASGDYSHAEGTNSTQALGYASHAEGSSSMAVGSCAHAENASWAFGNFSHSEGSSTAGHKLFTVTEGVANEDGTGTYTLSSVDNLAKNMKISLYNSSVDTSDNIDFATITAVSKVLKQIIVDKFYTPETYPIYIYVKEYPNYGDTVLENGEESNHAEGYNTYAIGDYSHSEGYDTKTIGKISHSEGYNTSAMGYVSHVEGNNNIVYSEGSHGEGCDNIAGRMCYMVRSGIDNGDGTGTYVLSSVTGLSVGYSITFPTNGIGRDNIDQAKITAIDTTNNTITVDKYVLSDGHPLYIYDSPKLGDTLLSGTYIKNIHVEGSENKALGNISHAEGNQTTAYGKYSHSEGCLTIASGNSSHSEGTQTEASGMHSHAEGGSTYAIGQWSHAEGNMTNSIGQGCHTEGVGTTAGQNGYVIRSKRSEVVDGVTIGYYTFNSTEGYSVGDIISLGTGARSRQLTSFYNNFAEIISINTDTNEIGVDNYIDYTDKVGVIYKFNSEFDSFYGDTIIGQYSHVEGGYTIAGGDYSHAEGYYTIGTGKYSHTEGKYNAIDKYNDYVHIVGNGTSDTSRSNAHTLDWDGNAWYAGDIKVGGTSYDDENAQILATKTELDKKQDINTIMKVEQEYPQYGDELLNSTDWILGTGWSGDLENGFTHASGSTEPLTFTMSSTGTKLFRICFNSSVALTDTNLLVSIGNSDFVQLYGQPTPIIVGIQSVSDGNLIFSPASSYTGTVTITSVKEIVGVSNPVSIITDSNDIVTSEYRYSDNTLRNVFIGKSVGQYNDNGRENVGVGSEALSKNISGFWNVGLGRNALKNNTAGSRNIAIGYIALQQNTIGCRNIAIGSFALNHNTNGSWNIGIGADCLDHNTEGKNNVAVGFSSMYLNTTGEKNTSVGSKSLNNITTGGNNVAIGYSSGAGIKTGNGNMAIGYGSMSYLSSGSYNVAIGMNSLFYTVGGSQNVAIGQGAGDGASNNNIRRNVFIGANTGAEIAGTSERNVIVGFNSGNSLTTGNRNIIIGAYCEVGESVNDKLNIGDLITGDMTSNSKSVTINGRLAINDLPTSTPSGANQLWNDNGVVRVNDGAEVKTIMTSDNAYSKTEIDELLNNKAKKPVVATVAIPTTGWITKQDSNNEDYYELILDVANVTADGQSIIDVAFSDDIAIARTEKVAYQCVDRCIVNDGSVTLYCFDELPTTAFTLRIQIIY